MREKDSDIMSDIISAKCFGCGNTVKVPIALGGKKARCPQCGDVINIPNTPNVGDTNSELVADADLPEVAREGEVIGPDDEIIQPDQVSENPARTEPTPSRVRRAKGTGRRPGSSSRTANVQGRGTQSRKPAAPPRSPGSPTGLYIGIGVGVLVLVLAAVGLSGGGEKKGPRKSPKDKGEDIVKPPPPAAVDSELEGRFLEWVRAINRSDPKAVLAYHTFSEADASAVRKAVYDLVGGGTRFENVTVKGADPASGVVAFSYASAPGGPLQERTLQWSRVDGVWHVQGKP